MPLLESSYTPPKIFENYHFSTIYSAVFRKVKVEQTRRRFELSDGDFIDLDWSFSNPKAEQALIVCHGLAGNSRRSYVKGIARQFQTAGWDVVAINFRGCSGELNRKYPSYHAGATDDLHQVIQHLVTMGYRSLALCGFSLGANAMLKYLGGRRMLPPEIKAAVMVSVPCDLKGSLEKLLEKRNYLYSKRFLIRLKQDLRQRAKKFPQKLEKDRIASIGNILEFDDYYTSKAHGYQDAEEYYSKASSLQFLSNIHIPTLVINAANDGFLSASCYPEHIAADNKNFYLEIPSYGGHVGFLEKDQVSYTEKRSLEFIEEVLKKASKNESLLTSKISVVN